MSEPFLGEIRLVGFDFPPRGWASCMGQLLPINQNQALFSLLGTQFGGNGTTNFALPDFRGRVGLGQGQGPGLPNYIIGERGGEPTHTVTLNEMPSHGHAFGVASASATSGDPAAGSYATPNTNPRMRNLYGAAPNAAGPNLGNTGGGQPHNNMQPFLALNFVIALQGIFPSRN